MLAMSCTFALLGWAGVRFNSMMSISPFLVLGVGVDDAFLLVSFLIKNIQFLTLFYRCLLKIDISRFIHGENTQNEMRIQLKLWNL